MTSRVNHVFRRVGVPSTACIVSDSQKKDFRSGMRGVNQAGKSGLYNANQVSYNVVLVFSIVFIPLVKFYHKMLF